MKKEKINYKFIAVPQKLYKVLDNNCKIVMTALIELDSVFADNDGWFFRSNSDLIEETKLSKNLLNAVLVTLNRNNLLEVHKPNRNVNTNSYRINFDEITRYDSIPFEELKKIEIKTLNYKDSEFKVTFTEVHSVNTSKDNSSLSEQGEVHVVNNRSSLSEHNNILYNIKDNSNNNINNNNIDSNNSNNIDNNNNNIYYSVHAVNNTKVNCFLTKEEIESYDNSNYNNLKKEELKENIDNSKLDNITANAESVNSNKENLKKKGIESNNLDNSNSVKPVIEEEIEESKELVNSNEVNTAVLSNSCTLNEESVISTEKMSENGLKQAKTRELEIVNKTDNSNSVKSNNTANAVTEETVYSNIDNSKEVEGNNNRDNFNYVNSDNRTDNSNSVKSNSTANAESGIEESVNSKNVIPNNNLDNSNNVNSNTANAELESNNSVNSNSVNSENNLDNSNDVKPNKEGIEGENKTDNSNEGINITIAEGDNSTANAVQEFRNKCIKYTIILEGKKIEIDRTIDEFVREYYSEIMNNILTTKEFEEQRKIFNRMVVDNNLNDTKYNEMCDKLDIRYSRYVELDNQLDKSKKEKEFTQEQAEFIANELLDRCLNCGLDSDNNLTNFYRYRNNYNFFIEEYNLPKEGSKLQKKFAELISEKKKRNESVKAKAFAN